MLSKNRSKSWQRAKSFLKGRRRHSDGTVEPQLNKFSDVVAEVGRHAVIRLASQKRLEDALARPGTPPTIVLPPSGYWADDDDVEYRAQPSPPPQTDIDIDDIAKSYRQFFFGKEHVNLVASKEEVPLVVSIKKEHIAGLDHTRVLLRLRTGTIHRIVAGNNYSSALELIRTLNEPVNFEKLEPVTCLKASGLILEYDEHILVNNYKFGVLYQMYGQTTEEQLFSNTEMSPEFQEFLEMLGERIQLLGHEGYSGGLDVKNGHTGTEAVYEQHHNREIMFHVAPLLPHTAGDAQQLQRKRHVGNDIVAIVFQDKATPFTPDMIVSQLLHAFIVVTYLGTSDGETRYKVSVTARDDVPTLMPTLPQPPIFNKGPEFKEFLLTKLINTEHACYKANRLSSMAFLARDAMLKKLIKDLKVKTDEFLGTETDTVIPEDSGSQFGTLKKTCSHKVSRQSIYTGRNNKDRRTGEDSFFPEETQTLDRPQTKISNRFSSVTLTGTSPIPDYVRPAEESSELCASVGSDQGVTSLSPGGLCCLSPNELSDNSSVCSLNTNDAVFIDSDSGIESPFVTGATSTSTTSSPHWTRRNFTFF